MARCLKVPSQKFRDKLATTLEGYITTMARLLPAVPPRSLVEERYLAAVADCLGDEVRDSEPTPAERGAIDAREKSMADPAFIYQFGRRSVASGIKIAAAHHLTEGAWKAAGGLIRVLLLEREGAIADLDISGDFTCLPASGLAALAARLRGAPVERAPLSGIIARAITDLELDLPGAAPRRPRPRHRGVPPCRAMTPAIPPLPATASSHWGKWQSPRNERGRRLQSGVEQNRPADRVSSPIRAAG